jgi:hypothetical protein
MIVAQNLGILYTYQHPPSRADEVRGEPWQLITAIHDDGDSLIICDWRS